MADGNAPFVAGLVALSESQNASADGNHGALYAAFFKVGLCGVAGRSLSDRAEVNALPLCKRNAF